MTGTFSFEAMQGAPKGARAFQCQGGSCSVLVCEFNDQGRIGYEGTLISMKAGQPVIVHLLPEFVKGVYRKIDASRN